MPLRREIVDLDRAALRDEAAAYFGLDAARPTLLVFGGSLGAQRLNEAFGGAWQDVLDAGWQLVHVTGERSELPDPGAAGYAVRRYVDRMDLAFALCDLIVSRAGAATVSEISALGIPAVYVPYAVGNGEQALNAASAVHAGAAILIPDAEFTADRVRSEIVPLLADQGRRETMTAAAASVGTRNGTRERGGDDRRSTGVGSMMRASRVAAVLLVCGFAAGASGCAAGPTGRWRRRRSSPTARSCRRAVRSNSRRAMRSPARTWSAWRAPEKRAPSSPSPARRRRAIR